jgi:deazaflavin-dependent oxidoreductase (nitroreductase family)
MAARWHRAFGRVHRALYRATGGRLGSRLAGIPMLLLTTVGRRSCQRRTLPLAYLSDDDDLVVVASNGGSDRDPAWWCNLLANPEAEVQVGAQTRRVRASLATPEERSRLWPRLVASNRSWAGYEQKTARRIPVVVLRRAGP